MTAKKKKNGPTVIKKYANRRLYDTGRSSYVTLDDLCLMVKEGHNFTVCDAKTGDDLTRQVLTQIIVEQESKGEHLLPIPFLRDLIGYYGDSLQSVVPDYLEQTLDSFTKNQEQFRDQINESLGDITNPISAIEDLTRQNMALFESAMRTTWAPFTAEQKTGKAEEAGEASRHPQQAKDKISALQKNIEQMQKEIARLAKQL